MTPLVDALDTLNLKQFNYVSFHAPSKLVELSESEAVAILAPVADRGWPIIVHPDVITNWSVWKRLGDRLCLENMDKRKPTGRTAVELAPFFSHLPSATLCFDIGHARQIDPTMCEAHSILTRFQDRLQQVHMSLVNSSSVHEPLTYETILAFRRVAHLLPSDVPIILETPVGRDEIQAEIGKVARLLPLPV